MSLFPDIGVAGYGATNGFDPDGEALQKVIAKNMFQESDRGAPFFPAQVGINTREDPDADSHAALAARWP